MKTFAAFSALIAGIAAQDYFGVISARSASPIHLLPLQASGLKFYLGGSTSSYCPTQAGDICKSFPANTTGFGGGNGGLGLAVVVPGGQQVYVAPDGALSYTSPHSAYMPTNSTANGWTKKEGASYGTLEFKGGLIACPTASGKYQVYGQVAGFKATTGCLAFSALTGNLTGATAWQY